MNVNPAMPMPTPAMQPGNTSPGQELGKKNIAGGEHENAAGFDQKLQTQSAAQSQATGNVSATSGVNQTGGVNNATQVDTQNKIPDNQDMFGQLDKVRKDLDTYMQKAGDIDKQVADGTLKPNDPKVVQQRHEEMRMLLHFQSEMQSSAVKVEIASKVVDNGTSGIKTVLQTQA